MCKVEGCSKTEVSKGYCDTHRKRISRHGNVNAGRPLSWGAGEEALRIKKDWNFPPKPPRWYREGFTSENERLKAWLILDRELNPDKYWEKDLQKYYKIGIAEYTSMLESQNGLCAICRKPETIIIKGKVLRLSIDHCHTTGKIRGLLCSHCNHAIGKFEDSIDSLKAAITYLEKHNAIS